MDSATDTSGRARQWLPMLAWALAALSLGLQGASLVLYHPAEAWAGSILMVYSVIGLLIALHRPANPIGWLWLAGSICIGLSGLTSAYARYGLLHPGALPGSDLIASFGGPMGNVGFSLILPFTFLLFPSGRLPSPRWRPILWIALGNAILGLVALFRPGTVLGATVENRLGIEALRPVLSVTANAYGTLALALLVLGPLSTIARYRGAGSEERQQIKWFAYAATIVLVMFAAAQLVTGWLQVTGQWQLVLNLTWLLVNLLVTGSIGIAILAHGLYDIDVIIRKSIIYTGVTGVLTLVFFGTVIVAQRVFTGISGEGTPLALVVSTLVIAALFAPLRTRVQEFVDRRFYRRKYDAQQVLAQFNATARDETNIEELSAALLSAVADTMQPATAAVWLKGPGGKR